MTGGAAVRLVAVGIVAATVALAGCSSDGAHPSPTRSGSTPSAGSTSASSSTGDDWTLVTGGTEPLTGVVWSPAQVGWGTVRPRTIHNGGDPLGLIQHVRWSSYGGRVARGTGIGWVAGRRSVAGGHSARMRVVASDVGRCFGHDVYLRVVWFVPGHRPDRFASPVCPDAHGWIRDTRVWYPGVFAGESRCQRTVDLRPKAFPSRNLLMTASLGCATAAGVVAAAAGSEQLPAGWHCLKRKGNWLCAQAPAPVVGAADPTARGRAAFLRAPHIRLVSVSGYVPKPSR